jgi:hypothetical protein
MTKRSSKENKENPYSESKKPEDGEADLKGAVRQKQPEIEHIEPLQEPRIKASDLFTFSKRALSREARELLAKIDEGGIPLMITENLERIAKENGIEVGKNMTPEDIIKRLRKLA